MRPRSHGRTRTEEERGSGQPARPAPRSLDDRTGAVVGRSRGEEGDPAVHSFTSTSDDGRDGRQLEVGQWTRDDDG